MFEVRGAVLLLTVMQGISGRAISASPVILEGDIVLTESLKRLMWSEQTSERVRRSVSKPTTVLWPRPIIPFTVSPNVDASIRAFFKRVIALLHSTTCVRLKPRNRERDYIELVKGNGCYSPIGHQGGRQFITLGTWCASERVVMHEVMHAIGFFHEQSRLDRDNYVFINWKNIIPGTEKNFWTYSHGELDQVLTPYNAYSLMHYSNKDYSRNGLDTIQSKQNPLLPLGRAKTLSYIDQVLVKMAYQCPLPTYKQHQCKDRVWSCLSLMRLAPRICEELRNFSLHTCARSCKLCR